MNNSQKTTKPPVRDIYDALFRQWGPQHWWPGDTRLEIMVGAVLTQNTAWANVEKAIRQLKQAKALDLAILHNASLEQLADWIRPAGYFNVKARRLRALTDMIYRDYDGSLRRMFATATPELRTRLLAVNGVGPETADSILLYAGKRPVFVVDAYTRRFLEKHGWLAPKTPYDEVAALMQDCLPQDTQLYNEYHALIVNLGKEHCKPRPRCEGCPLNRWKRICA
jgi:endonuclease-3 related protein